MHDTLRNLSHLPARQEISRLCRLFWEQGWASGTGGGIAVRDGHTLLMAPSGVEKENIRPEDIFEVDLNGHVTQAPITPGLKLTACAPLFLAAFRHRNAGAVLHSHSLDIVLAAMTVPAGEPLRLTRLEMMKGLEGVGYFDVHEIPVIDNTALEHELEERVEQAILAYPKANAVIVRNHGVYIWGKSTVHAKTQAECLDWLCRAVIRMNAAGISHLTHDRSQPEAATAQPASASRALAVVS
ncbi:MAG: methylthioribulose 1-phosphate dehydratase [Deltaproteobacteria bacterium]|nr:methylthioribulose 1-phosphate dehydratase [Deltaproteobacteria bacterium]